MRQLGKLSGHIEISTELCRFEDGSILLSKGRVLSSELLGIRREVIIEHAGEEYRLRLTRQGKLILTK